MERIDKILSRELNITRSQSKTLLRSGRVALDGKVITSGDLKCPDDCAISVDGELISNNKYVYIMMNKPKGVISAAKSADDVTVVDILPQEMKRKNLFPAGRLTIFSVQKSISTKHILQRLTSRLIHRSPRILKTE